MIRNISMSIMLVLMLSACNLLAETETLELLNKSNEELVFLADGGVKTIVLVTDSDWTVECDAEWCKVSPEKGTAESARMMLVVEENDKEEEREADVAVSTATKSLQIRVVQKGRTADFTFSVTASGRDFVMPYVSGDFTGYVYWGDGSSSPFSSDLEEYRYDNDADHTVEMKLSGSSEDFAVEFEDIKGLVKVDLSGL